MIVLEIYFDEYKKIPQYKLLNFDMNLDEFKIIFYWEYFHRILARLIGLFFLIPLIYFILSKKIKKEYIKICY
jgi:cytochrome c oxidase assembly protein subunit 15